MPLSAVDDGAAWVADRVDELAQRVACMTVDELRVFPRSVMDGRRRGEYSREAFASALAVSREAVRRLTGRWPTPDVVGAVATAVAGAVPAVPAPGQRQAALAMALYWHSLAGQGVHLVSWDEASARRARKAFDPVGSLLGCASGLVTPAMTGTTRRSAYAAAVTFGSYQDLAADFLRDNLCDSRVDVVQRGLYAAVVDEVDVALAPRALSHVLITAPVASAQPERVRALAASFRPGSDYRTDREQPAILFTASAMSRLKAQVGWGAACAPEAVTTAARVENVILRREGLGRTDGRETLTEISVQGYLATYEAVTSFSCGGERAASIDDVLAAAGRGMPDPRELAFERLIDRQRLQIYRFRTRVRDEPDPLHLMPPLVSGAVQAYLTGGAARLTAGLHDVLSGRRAAEHIREALDDAATHDELADRATLLLRQAVKERTDELGAHEMAVLLRKVFCTVVDIHWREHLLRMRFLQRQSGALYDPAAEAADARGADGASLFTACQQAIRVESLKYGLNARL